MQTLKFISYKKILAILLTTLSLGVNSQETKAPSKTTTLNIVVSPLAQNLAKIGAFSCAERANQISNFLSPDGQHELILQTPKDNSNNRLLMASIVTKGINDTNILSSISLAPNQVNGCGGSYQTISHSPNTCSKASLSLFPKEKFQNIGKSKVKIAVISRALWIVALPINDGCIFIKEEIIE